jgi:hypothetical protein
MKKTGVKAGVPDIVIALAKGGYHGLYIEMKRVEGGQVSKKQQEWIDGLRLNDYRVEVCEGAKAAKAVVIEYLKG